MWTVLTSSPDRFTQTRPPRDVLKVGFLSMLPRVPALGGGDIDIHLLGVGATFYLPVFADGALFFVGDPQPGDGQR